MNALENIRAFMQSRVILTAVELDIFTRIHRGENTIAAIARDNRLDIRATNRLLDALVVFGLLFKEKGLYQLTPEAMCLSADHPHSALPMALHMNELWKKWSHLSDAVAVGKKPGRTAGKSISDIPAFIGAMHVVGRRLSQKIADTVDLSPFHKLLDIGGASGTYTIAFLRNNPEMRGVIFDLEPVIPMASAAISDAGLSDRVELVSGDFYEHELPKGCDLALLSAIIHQNSPDQNLALYRKVYRALLPAGALMIRDHIMDEDRTWPPAGAVFALNMLVATEGGDTYTFKEIQSALETAGFTDVRQLRQGENMDGIVMARKPS